MNLFSVIVAAVSLFGGGLLTYITILFISLLTVAIIVIVGLVCYYRRRMKTITGFLEYTHLIIR